MFRMIFHKSKIPNVSLTNNNGITKLPDLLPHLLFCVSSCLWFFFFCVSSVVICFTDASFLFSLFLNSYIDNDCFLLLFCLAWFHLPSTTYSDGFFLSQYHAIESVRVPILLVTNRFFGMWQKCVCVNKAHPKCVRIGTLLLVPSVVQVLFVCSFVKESLLVNFFVLLQHLCCLYYGTREVNFFCFVFIIGLFNDSSFMKTKNTTWFSIRNNI